MVKPRPKPGRKFTIKELADLRLQLKEAGISHSMVARYSGYYANLVSQALNGYSTISNVVEAARELVADPSLMDNVSHNHHPLKAKILEAGLAGKDLTRASGGTSSSTSKMLNGLARMPKRVEAIGEELIAMARAQGVDEAKAWARERWEKT